jgi:DDE family transposase
MVATSVQSLAEAFAHVPDPRDPRGVRYPIQVLVTLVFLGMLARLREMAVVVRWAGVHWDELAPALGCDRDRPPNATTISRALARCSLADFWTTFAAWLRCVALSEEPITVAVDGKTACQGLDEHGNPVQLLTVFVHQLKLVLGQWSVTGEKTNEPTVLKRHVAELLEAFPMLALLTGDALYAQRPLAEVLTTNHCDYLLAIKENQPDVLDALVTCLGQATERPPAAETTEKRGICWIVAGYG